MNNQAKQRQPKFVKHETAEYLIYVLENWAVQKIDKWRTIFYGPKVGTNNIGFYITILKSSEKPFMEVYKEACTKQKRGEEYQLHDEEDLSKEGLRSIMRHSSWYSPTIDMRLFIREIFIEFKGDIFILSSSIPNNPEIIELDTVITQMMNSFKITRR